MILIIPRDQNVFPKVSYIIYQDLRSFNPSFVVKFICLNPHSISTSTQTEHRLFPWPLVETSLQFTSTDEPPFDHQWASITFYNPIAGLKYKTTF